MWENKGLLGNQAATLCYIPGKVLLEVTRGPRGERTVELSITSDGFVLAGTDPVSSGVFIGTANEMDHNLQRLLADAKLTAEERAEFDTLYARNVKDWRRA